ncbi:MAG: nucleoside triphosphate pyrophosphohydrolase [Bacteroidetes bacterium]|nr:nucleoside triphosphate pyrophosphohydrolase [Bacteroidota bacterium]MBU2586421.1 nucleoside triphosphate pyrophosphohydrolase [Bacteroidota bacterium]
MAKEEFEKLENTVRRLRVECPWDRMQTNDSIKAATLEETYEVLEAIDQKDYEELKIELGDLLLHIVFHSLIAEDGKHFTLSEVINHITEKLIRRHPHVFEGIKIEDHHEVKRNWEMIKLSEGRISVVDGVPKELPALLRAFRLQEKASKFGFEWKTTKDAFKKVEEEIQEIEKSFEQKNIDHIEDEFGDLLFALVNFGRMNNINSEDALRKCNEKFIKRFQYVEKMVNKNSDDTNEDKLDQMLKYWEEAKKEII